MIVTTRTKKLKNKKKNLIINKWMNGKEKMNNYPIKFRDDDLVWFKSEKQKYTVVCASNRYAICTKPFNLKKTVFYTIIDQEKNIRGAENLIFGMGAETREQCLEMLVRLLDEETEISRRNCIPLDIKEVKSTVGKGWKCDEHNS